MNENIYFVEYQSRGDSITSREIVTASSIADLFEEFSPMAQLTYFAFEDISDASIEEIERKLSYNGKYSM